MRRYGRPIAIALMLIAAPALALAQDPIALPLAGDASLPVHETEDIDWNGFYAGIYGTGTASQPTDLQYGVGVNVGFNQAFDYVLVGGEVAFHGTGNDLVGASYLQAVGRGGVLVTNNVLVFGAAGVGTDPAALNGNHVLAGGGLELGITDNVSLRGQYLHGFSVTNTNAIEQVTVGAEFHF